MPHLPQTWYEANLGGLTVTVWANPRTSGSGTVFGCDDGAGGKALSLDLHKPGRFPVWRYGVNDTHAVSTFAQIGTWQHLALVVDRTQPRGHFNAGSPTPVGTGDAYTLGAAPLIGCLNAGGLPAAFFDGTIDELRLATQSRSADWLLAEYKTVAAHETLTSYEVIASYARDDDADGLPDRWEIESFGATNAPMGGVGEDWDGDTASNGDEFVAGTDATDATEFFALGLGVTGDQCRVSYRTVLPGAETGGRERLYTLYSATNLHPAVWLPVTGHANRPATGGSHSHTSSVNRNALFQGRVRLE